MSAKQKWIRILFIVVILVFLTILIYKSLTGIRDSGIASSTIDIPYVGKYLQDSVAK